MENLVAISGNFGSHEDGLAAFDLLGDDRLAGLSIDERSEVAIDRGKIGARVGQRIENHDGGLIAGRHMAEERGERGVRESLGGVECAATFLMFHPLRIEDLITDRRG